MIFGSAVNMDKWLNKGKDPKQPAKEAKKRERPPALKTEPVRSDGE